jgi:hypothetical protein
MHFGDVRESKRLCGGVGADRADEKSRAQVLVHVSAGRAYAARPGDRDRTAEPPPDSSGVSCGAVVAKAATH